jgi:hypothetical protein
VRYRIRIEDDDSLPGPDAEQRLIGFLTELSQAPDILNCGYNKPEKMNIYHAGTFWVLEGEVTVKERP